MIKKGKASSMEKKKIKPAQINHKKKNLCKSQNPFPEKQ